MPETEQELNINISDELILTPFTGASLVNEILKGLLYQKSQIPYPYSWLKQVVEKRRKKLNEGDTGPKKMNFTLENHYRVVSTAYDILDLVMKGITKEFCDRNNIVKEVVVVFGPSPNCPKEVFTIEIPSIATGHIERNHIGQLNKHLQKVLRNIFLSQTWMDSIDASSSCTNTYIYLKKQIKNSSSEFLNEAFELCQPFQVSPNIKHSKCSICYNPNERTNCCDNLLIFDEGGSDINEATTPSSACCEEQIVWCRSKRLIKGFKDCFVNKVSVCELW